MASRYRVRRKKRSRRLKRQKESWFRVGALRAGKAVLRFATVTSLILLGLSTYRYFQHSEQLNIDEVKIMGCMHIPESELLDMTEVDFRSNLLRLDLQEVSRRLTQHPWVEKAKVRRDFSGKALLIEVQERVPRALILLDELYVVDRNGEIFKKAELKEKLDFPILTGLTLQDWKQKDPKARELIRQALEVMELLGGGKVFSLREISEIHLDKKNGVTLYTLDSSVPIRLGLGDYGDKLNRLEKVFPDIRSKLKNMEYVALNYPKKVVVKMRVGRLEKSRSS